MCWPFSSPGGFSLLGKNALIEIFFCIPKHWKEATTGIQDKWINFIDFDHHQGWRKIPFYLHLSRSLQRFFSTFRKKLRWEAYSNFHQRLLQITRGRVNYGRSIIWRQKAWLWSTSLKVKYDWENCFCPKKSKVKKKEFTWVLNWFFTLSTTGICLEIIGLSDTTKNMISKNFSSHEWRWAFLLTIGKWSKNKRLFLLRWS